MEDVCEATRAPRCERERKEVRLGSGPLESRERRTAGERTVVVMDDDLEAPAARDVVLVLLDVLEERADRVGDRLERVEVDEAGLPDCVQGPTRSTLSPRGCRIAEERREGRTAHSVAAGPFNPDAARAARGRVLVPVQAARRCRYCETRRVSLVGAHRLASWAGADRGC